MNPVFEIYLFIYGKILVPTELLENGENLGISQQWIIVNVEY